MPLALCAVFLIVGVGGNVFAARLDVSNQALASAQLLPLLPKADKDADEKAEKAPAPQDLDPNFVAATPEELEKRYPRPLPLPDLSESPGPVLVVPIHGTIELGLAPFVSRAFREAAEMDAAVVILDVNTFGGRVDAAVEIRDAVLSSEIPTVAFVDRRAISAGALISLAAEYIVFAPGGTLGAATPVQMGQGEAKAVGEKMVSYMRSEMRSTAEARDRNGDLAAAMVDADESIAGVIPRGKLLTVTTELAQHTGLANAVIDDVNGVIDALGLKGRPVIEPTENWAEKFARFITDPTVSGILVSIGMLALMIELYSPGFGVAGAIGVACLALYLGGHLVVGLAGWEEILLVVGGIILLGVEIFVLPGFGVAGILGVCLLIAGLTLAMFGVPIDVAWGTGALLEAASIVVLALVAGAAALPLFIGLLRLLGVVPKSTGDKGWLFLRNNLANAHSGYTAAEVDDSAVPDLVGKEGVAATDLRPAGKAELDGRIVDVVCEHGYVDQGSRLRVLAVEGVRIVVAKIK